MTERPRSLLALATAAVAVASAGLRGVGYTMADELRKRGLSESTPRAGSAGIVPSPQHRGKGWSAAHVQRMKTKRRNKLRAKGQFRKAVR